MSTFRDHIIKVQIHAYADTPEDTNIFEAQADAILAMPEMKWLRQQAQQGQSGFDSMPDCLGEWLWGRR